jgi:hypothetical protein
VSNEKYLLVISADRKVRISKRPRVFADEIAIPVVLEYPPNWGRVLRDQSITIKVPDFTPEVIHDEPDQADEPEQADEPDQEESA